MINENKQKQPAILQKRTRQIPNYYKEMALDGFTPEEILWSAHQEMINRLVQLDDNDEATQVSFNVEVKKK